MSFLQLTSYSIDLVYLGRTTSWQPAEGKVPDPAPEYLDATYDDQDDE